MPRSLGRAEVTNSNVLQSSSGNPTQCRGCDVSPWMGRRLVGFTQKARHRTWTQCRHGQGSPLFLGVGLSLCVRARARARACVCVCARARVCACVRACVCVCCCCSCCCLILFTMSNLFILCCDRTCVCVCWVGRTLMTGQVDGVPHKSWSRDDHGRNGPGSRHAGQQHMQRGGRGRDEDEDMLEGIMRNMF